MAGLPGLNMLGGGLSSLLNKIPVVGGALSAAAPAIQTATGMIPGGAVANLALDAAGTAAKAASDASKEISAKSATSAINF